MERLGGRIGSVFGTNVPAMVVYRPEATREKIEGLAAKTNRAPRDVSVEVSGAEVRVTDSEAGYVAADTMEELLEELELRGVSVHIAAMKGPVRDVAARAGWPERFGPAIEHFSLEDALESLGLWKPQGGSSGAEPGGASDHSQDAPSEPEQGQKG